MAEQLKKGMRVKVYQKPITKEDFEGEAMLVAKSLLTATDPLEWWMVRFSDGGVYMRKVDPADVITA